MAAPKEKRETQEIIPGGPSSMTLVPAPDRSRLSALVGTIEDRIRAFEQIAANLATLQLNGWDNVQKCKAACWLADGAGMHPAIFMQNHYAMTIKGKLIIEPKWEFIVGVLQSRMLGFQMEVLVEADDCAEVRMSATGIKPQTVQYSLMDAKRQGLLGRDGNMWTSGNTREGCLKQAIKRCGRRIGAAALMDLPVGLDAYEIAEVEEQPTPAEAIDRAIEKATAKPVDVPFEEAGDDTPRSSGAGSGAQALAPAAGSERPAAPASDAPRVRLNAALAHHYGKLSKADAAAKVSELYAAMVKDRTGVEIKVDVKPGEIGPIEAEQLIEYIAGLLPLVPVSGKEWNANADALSDAINGPRGGGGSKTADAPVATSSAGALAPDDAPPPEEAEPVQGTAADAYEALMITVARARKLWPRKFILEAPPGSKKFWFVDQPTLSQTGDEESVKLQVGGDVVAPVEKMNQLNAALARLCDEKERGGRP